MDLTARTSTQRLQVAQDAARHGHARADAPRPGGALAGARCAAGGRRPAAAYTGAAARYPDRVAIVDERGTLTFEEVHRRTNALARELARGRRRAKATAWRSCAATTAASSRRRSPARSSAPSALYLNTAFAGPQIADVLAREDPVAVIYDEEFAGLVARGRRGAQALRRLERADGAEAAAMTRGSRS